MLCKVPAKCRQKQNRSGDKTLPNFIKRKHPSKGSEEETKGGQGPKSPGKQTAQKRRATRS
jgi:hypothetical protein